VADPLLLTTRSADTGHANPADPLFLDARRLTNRVKADQLALRDSRWEVDHA
jgi:hypothetical protein